MHNMAVVISPMLRRQMLRKKRPADTLCHDRYVQRIVAADTGADIEIVLSIVMFYLCEGCEKCFFERR